MPQKTPDENAKLTLDEGAFQRLLSAAFVIQEHNDSVKNQTPDPVEFKATDLSEIAETQNLIRGKRLDLLTAAAVIVERSQKISHAASGAIALLSKRELSYISSSGIAAPPVGTTVSLDESLSAECVRTGQFLLLPNLNAVARAQAKLFLSRGMQSFAAVPIHQDQQVAGVMELFFNSPNAIDGTTLRTCQLLAGLLTGTVTSQPDPVLRPSAQPATPPPTPLDQLKPQLDRMLEEEDPDALPGLLRNILQEPTTEPPAESGSPGGGSVGADPAGTNAYSGANTYKDQPPVVRCRKCGCPLEAQESFCGLCGTAREITSGPPAFKPARFEPGRFEPAKTGVRSPSFSKPPTSMEPATPSASFAEKPSSVVSPPPLSEPLPEPVEGPPDIPEKSEALPPELQEILARFPEEPEIIPPPPLNSASASGKIFDSGPIELAAPSALPNKDAQALPTPPGSTLMEPKPTEPKPSELKPTETKLTAPNPPANAAPDGTSSQVPPVDTFANPQWKSASETRAWLESVKVPPQRKHWMAEHRANLYLAAAAVLLLLVLFGVGMPADLQNGKAQLSWFDSMLVNLGLAEAPSAPVYLGNPTTKVWVDLHTALYYCPNAELYGKTRGGKFETQREAQQDQFEPASRNACP
ncbi:MAG TPA: GAF domain-containing protein [Terriglobales bacterium]